MADQSEKVLSMVPTADGTMTMRDSVTGELYHNSQGAFFEAINSYVLPARLEKILEVKSRQGSGVLRMLDGCFGLGYNTFALWHHILAATHLPIDGVEVIGVEKDQSLLQLLPTILQQECFNQIRVELRDNLGFSIVDNLKTFVNIGVPTPVLSLSYKTLDGPWFKLTLKFGDLRQVVPEMSRQIPSAFDLVFHDPFSPSKLPQLWTADLFSCYRKLLRPDVGRLLTYCAASAVRGGLLESGFAVLRTRDVGAKKGGTLAVCISNQRSSLINPEADSVDVVDIIASELVEDLIYNMEPEELDRLGTSSGIPYRDPTFNSDRLEIIKRREVEQALYKATMLGD
ncbi:MAG: hypothetical protein K2X93_17505 [Candidatus Obscuribacterales bacterium]|nr:hypothetical protein [Candidatus Obscuribacterales bacterium]